MKKYFMTLVSVILIAFFTLTGCEEKVITVEGDMSADAQEPPELIEVSHFEVKDNTDDGLIDIGTVALMIPDTYIKSEDNPNMYVSPIYPLDASNVYYTRSDGRSVGVVSRALTSEDYKKAIENAFLEDGSEIELTIDEFISESMEGVPAYKIRSHYGIDDREIEMLTYIIAASETYVVTYTQVSDDELFTDFMTDEGQIKLVREISGKP